MPPADVVKPPEDLLLLSTPAGGPLPAPLQDFPLQECSPPDGSSDAAFGTGSSPAHSPTAAARSFSSRTPVLSSAAGPFALDLGRGSSGMGAPALRRTSPRPCVPSILSHTTPRGSPRSTNSSGGAGGGTLPGASPMSPASQHGAGPAAGGDGAGAVRHSGGGGGGGGAGGGDSGIDGGGGFAAVNRAGNLRGWASCQDMHTPVSGGLDALLLLFNTPGHGSSPPAGGGNNANGGAPAPRLRGSISLDRSLDAVPRHGLPGNTYPGYSRRHSDFSRPTSTFHATAVTAGGTQAPHVSLEDQLDWVSLGEQFEFGGFSAASPSSAAGGHGHGHGFGGALDAPPGVPRPASTGSLTLDELLDRTAHHFSAAAAAVPRSAPTSATAAAAAAALVSGAFSPVAAAAPPAALAAPAAAGISAARPSRLVRVASHPLLAAISEQSSPAPARRQASCKRSSLLGEVSASLVAAEPPPPPPPLQAATASSHLRRVQSVADMAVARSWGSAGGGFSPPARELGGLVGPPVLGRWSSGMYHESRGTGEEPPAAYVAGQAFGTGHPRRLVHPSACGMRVVGLLG